MSEKKKKDKKKKEKIVYVDDGRTIADMSGTSRGGVFLPPSQSGKRQKRLQFKEVFKTYLSAVKMMFVPMLIVLGAITLVYLLLYLSMQ